MSMEKSKAIVLAAVQSGDFLLASQTCIALAKETKHDAELWEMAAQLCNQAGQPKAAATCYAYSARVFMAQKKPAQAISMMKHYAALSYQDPQQACRHLFFACRAGGLDCNICSIREVSQDVCCMLFRNDDFWRNIPDQAVATLLKGSSVHRYADGAYIAKEGSKSTSIYLVSHGSIQLQLNAVNGGQKSLSTIHTGSVCGEISYYLQWPERVYSIIAGDDCEVVEIPYQTLHKLCQQYPVIKKWMDHHFEKDILEHILANIPFFEKLETLKLYDISQQMQPKVFAAGDVVFQQDDIHDLDLFLIQTGWINLNYEWHNKTYHLCTLKPGDVFGAVAMIESKRKVTARSIAACKLMCWSESDFKAAYAQCFQLRDNVAESMARYQHALDEIRQYDPKSNAPQPEIDRVVLLDAMYCRNNIAQAYFNT
ncbi:MAG: cyclic nucleotide-binding domain-containing protein [Mariprofundaceae bacterium]|nr:cyclic nucleotide-binding domain-containing protein [Mariprofundaceae bacterium]